MLLYHSIKTKISIRTWKVKRIRKTTEGFLWSQKKGKTTSEHEKKIINASYQPGKKNNCEQKLIFQDS